VRRFFYKCHGDSSVSFVWRIGGEDIVAGLEIAVQIDVEDWEIIG
jgi:hypothetical protein